MNKLITYVKEWLKVVFLALFLALFFKSCFFDVFTIPSTSMASTLLPGDVVVVNKIRFGPKLFRSVLTIPFTHKYIPFTNGAKSFSEAIQLPYFRFPGYAQIKRNDLLVFHYPTDDLFPIDHRSYYIKRCVALPGETIKIEQDRLYVNDSVQKEPEHLTFRYIVQLEDNNEHAFDSLPILDGNRTIHKTIWEISLDSHMLETLARNKAVKSIERNRTKANTRDESIFSPNDGNWNSSHYGPLKVPKKGDTIALNESNLSIYKRLIKIYEGHQLETSPDGQIYIDKAPSSTYVPKMDYYFVLGDNRHNSSDSRFWGFVPEDHIQGKASLVLYSIRSHTNHQSGINWKRIFLSL